MLSTIVVPLDRSVLSEDALEMGSLIARGTNASITLALVHQPQTIGGMKLVPWTPAVWQDEAAYLQEVQDEVACGSGISVARAHLRGETVGALSTLARTLGAGLIVMSSHGRSGISRAWLGSVADGVIRSAPCPVLMLRRAGASGRRPARRPGIRRMLVLIDGSVESRAILPTVWELAGVLRASIDLLCVVQPVPYVSADATAAGYGFPPIVPDEVATDQLVRDTKQQMATLAREVGEHVAEVTSHVIVDGNVAQAILSFIRASSVDLVAMTTSGRDASRLIIGSVADKVLRGSQLPMLLYRPQAEMELAATSREASAERPSP